LAEILADVAVESLGKPLLVPIPMHEARKRTRGHNQTELLCEAALTHVSELYDYVPEALVRTKDTRAQQGLPEHARRSNVRNSMRAESTLVEGRVCIVVDDVHTTGATFREAQRALTSSGARSVECVPLARA
jgi:ComF family protein